MKAPRASGVPIRATRDPIARAETQAIRPIWKTALQLAKLQLRDRSTGTEFLYSQIRKYFDLATCEEACPSRDETIDMTARTFGVSPRTVENALAATKDVP